MFVFRCNIILLHCRYTHTGCLPPTMMKARRFCIHQASPTPQHLAHAPLPLISPQEKNRMEKKGPRRDFSTLLESGSAPSAPHFEVSRNRLRGLEPIGALRHLLHLNASHNLLIRTAASASFTRVVRLPLTCELQGVRTSLHRTGSRPVTCLTTCWRSSEIGKCIASCGSSTCASGSGKE